MFTLRVIHSLICSHTVLNDFAELSPLKKAFLAGTGHISKLNIGNQVQMYLRGSVSSGLNIKLADSYNDPSSNGGKAAPAVNMFLQVDACDYGCLCCTRVYFIIAGITIIAG